MSVALTNAHKEKFQDIGIPDPVHESCISKILDALVDDTDLWDVLQSQNNGPKSVTLRLQERAQFWERSLFTSGGKLKFVKCFWCLTKWSWDANGDPHLLPITDSPAKLHLCGGLDTTPTETVRKEPHEALETLGVWTSPCPHNPANFNSIIDQLTSMTNDIHSSYLTPESTSMLILVCLHAKLCYEFAATILS